MRAGSFVASIALAATGWLTAPVQAQIRIQDHVVAGADAAMRGFQESDFPRVHKLSEGMYAVEDLAGPIDSNTAFTTNAMFIVTADGVVVLDAFKDLASTTKLVNIIKGVTTQPIRYMVIGADHPDHTAGDQAFITAFPRVVFITHPNARISDAIRARVGLYVADNYTLTVGGVAMEIKFLGRAHTGSDLVVYLPQTKILWASETFFNGLYPSPGGGRSAYPVEWLDVLHKMDRIGATLILPNHGFIDSPKVLMHVWSEWLALFENLIAQGTALHARGTPLDGADYAMNIGRFQYWYRAANNLHTMLLRMYGELDGTLPAYVVTKRTPAVDMTGAALPASPTIKP
jgi:glyoxylase-like metal-dependent hydrolase (beta-lactamase superfamily II)